MGAAALVGVSAGLGVAGSLLGGSAASSEHQLQAALAARDAEIMARNAGLARQRSLQVAGMIRDQGNRVIAKTITSQAAGNVQLRSGTALAQVGGSAENVELSARSAVNDGVRAALGYEVQRDTYMIKSQSERSAARMSILAGIIGAAGSAAGGAAKIVGGSLLSGSAPMRSGDITTMDPTALGPGGSHEGWM